MHRLIDSLPEDATLGDPREMLYVREQMEAGRQSAREEPLLTTDAVFAEFDLDDSD